MHPYQSAAPQSFWAKAVADAEGENLTGLFTPKFLLGARDRIGTAGSCFAQHIGRALSRAGVQIVVTEPSPPFLSEDEAAHFGFGLYSCRYGNIYTPRQMVQLLAEALNDSAPETPIWRKKRRYFDALRPNIEPDGLESEREVRLHRAEHLAAIRTMLGQITTFIFTLGMTESWCDLASGRTLPLCPGVIAGEYSAESTAFQNFRYPEILADLAAIRSLLHQVNPAIRLLLTVSPVPLTATASGNHVLAATVRSKASLRAAAGDFAADHDDVDYFPSYEIITSPASRGQWYEPNLRQVRASGVARVMSCFLPAYGLADAYIAAPPASQVDEPASVICEEQLLEAFSG